MEAAFRNLSWSVIAVTAVLYVVSVAVYRLFFHPLARFPGPKLAAATRWYEAYYDIVQGGRYTFKIAQLHEKYGPIIRISPHELHINDPAFYEKLYRQEGRWDKYAWAYDAFGVPHATITTGDHHLHRHRRAPLNPFFSKGSVLGKERIIQRHAAKLRGRVAACASASRSDGRFNVGTAVSAFARDVALEFILGKSYNNLDADDFHEAVATIFQNGGNVWRVSKHFPWYGNLLQSIPPSVAAKMAQAGVQTFFDYLKDVEGIVKGILSDPSNSVTSTTTTPNRAKAPTLVHAIVQSDLPPAEKSFARVNNDISTITGAAFETTAQALRTILYYVYTDTEILRKLRAELAPAFPAGREHAEGGDDAYSYSQLEQKPYLTAVLMEGLRLMPGICTRMARIAPDRDLHYGAWSIPAGTPVGMTTLLMHLDPRVYANPTRFDPERWMDMDARRKAEKTYAPFSRGTRICLGMYLAWAELYIVMASFVMEFDIKFDKSLLDNIEPYSDSFIIATKKQSGFEGLVTKWERD